MNLVDQRGTGLTIALRGHHAQAPVNGPQGGRVPIWIAVLIAVAPLLVAIPPVAVTAVVTAGRVNC